MTKRISYFLIILLLFFTFNVLLSSPVLAEGYWELSGKEEISFIPIENQTVGWSQEVIEISDGYASCYSIKEECYYERSASWTPPPGKLYPGEKFFPSASIENLESRTYYAEGLSFKMFFQDTSGFGGDIIPHMAIDAGDPIGVPVTGTGEGVVSTKDYGAYGGPPTGIMYIKAQATLGVAELTMGITYVYTWHEGGTAGEGTDIVNETKWKVEGSPVSWIFYKDGTIEAPGLWSGTWELTIDGYVINISQQGLSDSFTVIFSSDGQALTAYKNGEIYKKGSRI